MCTVSSIILCIFFTVCYILRKNSDEIEEKTPVFRRRDKEGYYFMFPTQQQTDLIEEKKIK